MTAYLDTSPANPVVNEAINITDKLLINYIFLDLYYFSIHKHCIKC